MGTRRSPRGCKSASQIENNSLTTAEAAFVGEYVRSFNLSAAARAYGSSAKELSGAGAAILAKSHIQAAVNASVTKAQQALSIDAEWVMRELKETYDRARA